MSDVHAAEAEQVVHDPAIEQEARDYGWAPKENFKGPEDKWKPAGDYVEWAKQSGRLPRGEFDKLVKELPTIRRENEQLKAQLTEINGTLNQFVEFSSKAEERAFNRARQELAGKIEQAAANADPAAARAAMAELEALTPEAPKPKPAQQTVAVDPVIQDWLGKESWYTDPKNRTLTAFATEEFENLSGMATAERLAEVKKRTVAKFPEKFGINPARESAASVATPSGQTIQRKSGKKTYDDLPADAKQACDKFVKTIPGYTRDKYVADYDWS